jgi:hypothetical protein
MDMTERWIVEVSKEGRRISRRYFDSEEEARAAQERAVARSKDQLSVRVYRPAA